jgi:serine/threonine-protein kinase
VGAALRVRGGDEIETEAMAQGEQPLGACVVTGPGRLACRHVLHAVSAWEHASCVGRATQRALLVAERLGLRRLALPALGTGAAGVTLEACAAAMAAAVRLHLALGGTHLEELGFVLYDAPTERVFAEVLEAELLGEVEQVDPGLPHVAASIDAGGASVDAATRLGGASATPSNTPPRPAGSGDA